MNASHHSALNNRRRLIRSASTIGVTLVLIYLLSCGTLYLSQGSLVFPITAAGVPIEPVPAGVEQVRLTTPTGDSIEAWFLPGNGRSAESTGPAVMHFHGNAELIDHNFDRAQRYADEGVSVLLMEYRGYGRSEGSPSQRAIVEDAVRFREWLKERPEVDPQRVIYHGRSLGGGVAAQLASTHEPAALILESTFTSVASFASKFFMPEWIVRHPFRTDRVLPTLDCPVLLLHGTDDTIIPPSHSERLAELSPNAKLVLLDGGHNDFPRDVGAYWDTVITYVQMSSRAVE